MAIKELFYDQRPVALLNPSASQRIDPRFKFTRDSVATYTAQDGTVKLASINQPRIDHDPSNQGTAGLLLEESRTNIILNSNDLRDSCFQTTGSGTDADGAYVTYAGANKGYIGSIAPTGETSARIKTPTNWTSNDGFSKTRTPFVLSFPVNTQGYASIFYKNDPTDPVQQIALQGQHNVQGSSHFVVVNLLESPGVQYANGWKRIKVDLGVSTIDFNYFSLYLYANHPTAKYCEFAGLQCEAGSFASSYIPTAATAVTRSADLLSVDSLTIPSTGSVYIDARAIAAAENDALISLKNASNEKINLSYESNAATYNSLALIASYKGASKSSLPLPVPTTARERNIITWGANNYQYTTDSSRYATSLSSSVPANLTQLSIGHDAVDPTKAFNGHINAVYLYSGEITPTVAEALVRGELDPINADTYSPVGPTGSLALVINTQGATADGDKTFTLPAKSTQSDNDIKITWGDGTESGLNGAAAELGATGLTHTYNAAGIYPVWVEGQMEDLQFNNIANAPDLVQIAAWGTTADDNDVFLSPSTMNSAFYGCTQMDFSTSARTTNLPDTSAVTDWYRAFLNCSGITGTFPAFNFSAATTFQQAWQGCSGLTSFPAASNQTQNVTNFERAWRGCSSLTNFPLINTSNGENFSQAWYECGTLPSFPLINTSSADNFSAAWFGCSNLDNIANAGEATSFPSIDTSSGTNFGGAWGNCSSLTIFPLIITSLGTDFSSAWSGCSSLTSFPLINTSNGENFSQAWSGCSSLNNIGVVSGATTSFPLIDTTSGTNFGGAWGNCSSLTIFPSIDTSLGTNFKSAWSGCSSLTSFPASFFDSWSPASVADECFYQTWDGCSSLTPASVVNILNSIAASGQSAPSGTDTNDKKITIDWDGTGTPATDAATAIGTLKSRNWEIYLNNVLQ